MCVCVYSLPLSFSLHPPCGSFVLVSMAKTKLTARATQQGRIALCLGNSSGALVEVFLGYLDLGYCGY